MHGLPEQVAIQLGDLADVDPDADFSTALRVGGVVLGAMAAAAARTAAASEGKEMRNPSPRDLRTRPPNAATWCCTIAACNPRMSSAHWSPRARRSSVEPTMSVIMIVSTLAAGLRSDKTCLRVSWLERDLPVQTYGVKAAACYRQLAQHR